MSAGFSGLPDQPVTKAATQAVAQHEAIEFCHPVYRLADEPDLVVVIALGTGDYAYFLDYNPEEQHWEQLVATEMPEAITDEIPFSEEEVTERLMEHYDEGDIEAAGYPNNLLY